jgi:hypothetical protein
MSQYNALGNPEQAHGQRVGEAQAGFDKVGEGALEVEKAIMETQAMAVALRTYAVSGALPDDARGKLTTDIEDATKEARAIEDELHEIGSEIVLGKDLAPVGDQDLLAARALRQQVIAAQNSEQLSLASSGKMSPLADQAGRLAQQLEQTDAQIDALVARGIEEIKATLAKERNNISEYKGLLAEYEQEARTVGSEILAASFKAVKDKLYDVVIRTDVGNVDVAWSQKEDNDDDLKRLGLARSRDLKQLRDEFKFVLDEATQTPSAPKPSVLPPASTEGGSGSASPDQGGATDSRVKPAGDQKTGSQQPTVKPGTDTSTAPAPAPKKGGNK